MPRQRDRHVAKVLWRVAKKAWTQTHLCPMAPQRSLGIDCEPRMPNPRTRPPDRAVCESEPRAFHRPSYQLTSNRLGARNALRTPEIFNGYVHVLLVNEKNTDW